MEHIKMVNIIVKKVASDLVDRNQRIHLPPLAMHEEIRMSCT